MARYLNELSRTGTAVYDGTARGIESLSQEPSPKAVIVFTDGETNADVSYDIDSVTAKANNEGVPLYTVGLEIDPQNLRDMAAATEGKYYYAPSAREMAEIYMRRSPEMSEVSIPSVTPPTIRNLTARPARSRSPATASREQRFMW